MSTNKRGAEEQLRKDDQDANSDEEEGEGAGGTWNRASADVLAARRIVKVGGKTATSIVESDSASKLKVDDTKPKLHIVTESTETAVAPNPFASINLIAKPAATDDSGFLAYTNVNPFKSTIITPLNGPSSKSPKLNPFSSTSPVVNPFMSFVEKKEDLWNSMSKVSESSVHARKESSAGVKAEDNDDAEDDDEDDGEPAVKSDKAQPVYSLHASGPILTGEEDEEPVFETRAKLFRMDDKGKSGWVDIGTGPIRVLKPRGEGGAADKGRVVMRRESQPGGAGTKLLVNVLLNKSHVWAALHGDRAMRLTTVCGNSPVAESEGGPPLARAHTYLIKTKHVQVCCSSVCLSVCMYVCMYVCVSVRHPLPSSTPMFVGRGAAVQVRGGASPLN